MVRISIRKTLWGVLHNIEGVLFNVSSVGQPSSILVSSFYSMTHRYWARTNLLIRKSDISTYKTKVRCLEIT